MDIKQLIAYVVLGIVLGMSAYTLYLKASFDDDFKKSWLLRAYADHVTKNKLPLLDANLFGTGWYSDRDLEGYYEIVKRNYKYDQELYNCKYWALNWALYFEKHGVDYQIIITENHTFVLATYDDQYCIADGKNLECFIYLENEN